MIGPKRLRLKCVYVCLVVAVVLLIPGAAAAQTGSVILKGAVSQTVSLSVVPDMNTVVVSSGNTVRITLSDDHPVIRVPLLVRSNSSFRISATIEEAALLSELSIIDVRSTGNLVSPNALTALNVPQQFDFRGIDETASSTNNLLDFSRPFLLVSGPRISLGGTLGTPTNALQITVLVRLKSQPTRGSMVHVTIAATADQGIQ